MIYGTDGRPINEAKQIKGQEYRRLSSTSDNTMSTDISTGGNTAGTTSLGKGGVLDSVAQHHIEELDVEKEKTLLESKNILEEYNTYIDLQFDRARNHYYKSDEGSQLEKRMYEDYLSLSAIFSYSDVKKMIKDNYYGGDEIFKKVYKNGNTTPTTQKEIEDAQTILRTILRLRMNYVNKITDLMSKMLRINYKQLGLSEEQAKIYIDSLESGTNDSVKTAGKVKEIIKDNVDKYVTNGGQSIDLRPLGFGVILGPSKGYKLNFAGYAESNKDGMLSLLQQAMRYDVVVVAHGGDIQTKILTPGSKKQINMLLTSTLEKLNEFSQNTTNKANDKIYKIINDGYELTDIQAVTTGLLQVSTMHDQKISKKINSLNYSEMFKKIDSEDLDDPDKLYKYVGKEYILPLLHDFFDKNYNKYEKYVSKTLTDTQKTILNKYKDDIKYNVKLLKYNQVATNVFNKMNQSAKSEDIEGGSWWCQPTRTLKAGPFEDVNDLVRQLIKEGYKKILIEDCNPGGHKLDKDIMDTKGILINHSNFSNYIESSLIDTNDSDYYSINEAEESIIEFADSFDIDYYDDEYLAECCNWYNENYEAIQEGKIIEALKEFFKRIAGAIVGFLKNIMDLVKKAFHKLKEKFFGTKEEPKDSKTNFQKPVETNIVNIKERKVDKTVSNNREDLERTASKMCSDISDGIKDLNQKQQSSFRNIERDIDELQKKEDQIQQKHESMNYSDLFGYFLEADIDLLDTINILNEFEADGQPADDEDTDNEEFPMDDEEQNAPNAEETPEAQQDDAPPEDAPDDQEFDMGEDNQEDQIPEENNENQDQPDDAPEDDTNEEDENFDLPDEGEGEGNAENAPPDDAGDENFDMDNAGDDTADDGGDTGEMGTGSTADQGTLDPKLKDLESVIFDDLSENEKKMKIIELKDTFISVYKKCDSILEIITEVKKDEETIQIVEYISNTLIDLKHYVNDYINNVFDYKTYVENLTQLQKYIMIFNAINKVFDQIKRENNE